MMAPDEPTTAELQPFDEMRSFLGKRVKVTLDYDLGEGRFEALDKHMLADDTARQLEEMRSRVPVYADDEDVPDA